MTPTLAILCYLAGVVSTIAAGICHSAPVVTRVCTWCGRPMAMGTRAELRRMGWIVRRDCCKSCQRDRFLHLLTDEELEALTVNEEGK